MNLNLGSISDQFKNLDFKEMGHWPAAPKAAVMALLFVSIGALAWYFVLDDKWAELEAAQLQEEKLRRDYTERLKKSVNLQALKAQKIKVTAYVADLERQLPDKAEMDKLLSDINYAGLSKGLQFELFKPGNVKVENYYAELPIAIKITGTYHKLAGFVADVSGLSRIVTLNNISLVAAPVNPNAPTSGVTTVASNASSTPLILEATAKTFRYLDQEETDRVAKLKAESLKK